MFDPQKANIDLEASFRIKGSETKIFYQFCEDIYSN